MTDKRLKQPQTQDVFLPVFAHFHPRVLFRALAALYGSHFKIFPPPLSSWAFV